MVKGYIMELEYQGGYIYFREDHKNRLHGQYTTYEDGFIDSREDFFIYEEGGQCTMDFFDQGVYLGSLIKDTKCEIFETLKSDKNWVFDMVSIDKNYWNYDE